MPHAASRGTQVFLVILHSLILYGKFPYFASKKFRKIEKFSENRGLFTDKAVKSRSWQKE
ncbi:hypothetical protein OBV_40090 [Oscillibacter valericigenes Sjm18-20]|nr:hypothetical protein OBV_40090 [Oscillibacter valericigenes Sjm18-20]